MSSAERSNLPASSPPAAIAEYTEIDGLADDVSDVFLIVVFVDANEYH